uniref:NF-X1-type domain-containing protein n=1 Tax=Chromera velia CCMP2878 TaxID=1169474 RepID=A0A0G4HLA8_9ALVE|eukprot:Cvel_7410.t1-p1 / transcript=Cvel_7410.t1 / gene=Cvel_7410 / organism=Chromera_velia_CCMP2878 / gene_product=NF-X1-type zinc finger protein NFXL1, putative / transcript_product=NF-X1-type zinc finger protein NFXL1, putative / location=Cvel_scaffold387:1795-8702(-) / protein_length=1547 / sequence_SO=supercontig / SO=protein_coding / is_pseudo=false
MERDRKWKGGRGGGGGSQPRQQQQEYRDLWDEKPLPASMASLFTAGFNPCAGASSSSGGGGGGGGKNHRRNPNPPPMQFAPADDSGDRGFNDVPPFGNFFTYDHYNGSGPGPRPGGGPVDGGGGRGGRGPGQGQVGVGLPANDYGFDREQERDRGWGGREREDGRGGGRKGGGQGGKKQGGGEGRGGGRQGRDGNGNQDRGGRGRQTEPQQQSVGTDRNTAGMEGNWRGFPEAHGPVSSSYQQQYQYQQANQQNQAHQPCEDRGPGQGQGGGGNKNTNRRGGGQQKGQQGEKTGGRGGGRGGGDSGPAAPQRSASPPDTSSSSSSMAAAAAAAVPVASENLQWRPRSSAYETAAAESTKERERERLSPVHEDSRRGDGGGERHHIRPPPAAPSGGRRHETAGDRRRERGRGGGDLNAGGMGGRQVGYRESRGEREKERERESRRRNEEDVTDDGEDDDERGDMDGEGDEEGGENFAELLQFLPRSQVRERLQKQLQWNRYDCMVCMDKVKRHHPIWHCSNCWAVFHLRCIRGWAQQSKKQASAAAAAASAAPSQTSQMLLAFSSRMRRGGEAAPNDGPAAAGGGSSGSSSSSSAAAAVLGGDSDGYSFRCPACNHVHTMTQLPSYFCFCGRERDPPQDQQVLPHSCGGPCSRPRPKLPGGETACPHPCSILCHPGPCPPCSALGPVLSCHCGKEMRQHRCGDLDLHSCSKPCGKPLGCGNHPCQKPCHPGPCPPCDHKISLSCHCGKRTEDRACGETEWTCGEPCGKPKDCGKHECEKVCHDGPCEPCPRVPGRVRTCPCGATASGPVKTALDARTSCRDEIPTCGAICRKELGCGHRCQVECHDSDCPPCRASVSQRCRCGKASRTGECSETAGGTSEFRCDAPCKTKKSCGRHRCQENCCPSQGNVHAEEHLCLLVCGKPLHCGNHVCEAFCHLGKCAPCSVVSSQPVYCACGSKSTPPPVPCGAPPPECTRPCNRELDCGHLCQASCHFGDCPRCTALVDKPCAGGHTIRQSVPCHVSNAKISCGAPCGKKLPCSRHACQKGCHAGDCPLPCKQTCERKRLYCEHGCQDPCHEFSEAAGGKCPDVPCRVSVSRTCGCGKRSIEEVCGAWGGNPRVGERPNLDCDASCQELKRQKQLKDAFSKGGESSEDFYDEELLDFCRRDARFVSTLETKLEQAVRNRAVAVHLPPADAARRQFAQSLAQVHYRLRCSVLRDMGDRQPHVCVSFDASCSRIPSPLLSAVTEKTPDLSRIERPPVGFRKKNVLRFGKENPQIIFYDLAVTVQTLEVVDFLSAFVGNFRVRWEADKTTAVAEFVEEQVAKAAYKHIKSLVCPAPFNNFKLELPALTRPPTDSGTGSAWAKRGGGAGLGGGSTAASATAAAAAAVASPGWVQAGGGRVERKDSGSKAAAAAPPALGSWAALGRAAAAAGNKMGGAVSGSSSGLSLGGGKGSAVAASSVVGSGGISLGAPRESLGGGGGLGSSSSIREKETVLESPSGHFKMTRPGELKASLSRAGERKGDEDGDSVKGKKEEKKDEALVECWEDL